MSSVPRLAETPRPPSQSIRQANLPSSIVTPQQHGEDASRNRSAQDADKIRSMAWKVRQFLGLAWGAEAWETRVRSVPTQNRRRRTYLMVGGLRKRPTSTTSNWLVGVDTGDNRFRTRSSRQHKISNFSSEPSDQHPSPCLAWSLLHLLLLDRAEPPGRP